MSVRLGEILVKESLITQDQLQKALEFQRANGGKLGSCLTKMGFITDDDITGVLSRQYGVPSINLKYYEIDPNVIRLIPQDTALRYQVVPLSRVGSVLTIAMTAPTPMMIPSAVRTERILFRRNARNAILKVELSLIAKPLRFAPLHRSRRSSAPIPAPRLVDA
jgi:hypothetical protein